MLNNLTNNLTNNDNSRLYCLVIVAVALNLVLPMIAKHFASAHTVTAPDGIKKLSLWDQMVNMLVHHSEVPVSSSIIIAVVVAASLMICNNQNKFMP